MIRIVFKYEHLPSFCFYYGKLGHLEKGCDQKIEDCTKNNICEGKFGDCLRAPLIKGGKRGELGGLGLNRSRRAWPRRRVGNVVKDSQIVKMDKMGEMPRESGMIEHMDESCKKFERAEVRVEGVRGNDNDPCLESQGE